MLLYLLKYLSYQLTRVLLACDGYIDSRKEREREKAATKTERGEKIETNVKIPNLTNYRSVVNLCL